MEHSKPTGAYAVRLKYPGLRSGLIVPGHIPKNLEKASQSRGDVMHIELEDGVPDDRKQEARETTTKALNQLNWSGKLTLVRVNCVESGFLEDDIDVVAHGRPTAFLLAKAQGPEDIKYLDHLISRAEKKAKIEPGTIKIASMIERAKALQRIDEIATASPRMMALYTGATDLSTEVGYRRTYKGQELEVSWYRSRIVFAAHCAELLAIDSPTTYYKDLEDSLIQAKWAYHLGFDAKTCVSPRQIDAVNKGFTPSDEDVAWAKKIFEGKKIAEAQGLSVWVSDGMMVDEAFIARATQILALHEKSLDDPKE
jgi:citrate lyase subunit beta/citryl-CoA lyase